jgi:hypothetical protein
MDTLQAHVLAVAHNLATYLYYNVFAPFYKVGLLTPTMACGSMALPLTIQLIAEGRWSIGSVLGGQFWQSTFVFLSNVVG